MEQTYYYLLCSIMEQLKKTFSSFCSDFIIINFEGQSDNNFKSKIQCSLICEGSYDEKCGHIIKVISEDTCTNWIMKRRYPGIVRYEFRKTFVCHLAKRNKSLNKSKGVNRNYDCKANINIKFLKVTKNTLKSSKLLRKGLDVLVEIDYNHSHRAKVAQALGLLRCSEETKNIFTSYFKSGMTPAAAKTYHELNIVENNDIDAYTILANAQLNPTDRQVLHLYEQWRIKNYGDRDEKNIVELMKTKQNEMLELGIHLHIMENPTICIIITPIMQRVIMKGLADEMVFIDSSGSCDQNNTCVTFIFTASKVGALPVSVILHTSQSENQYTLAFKGVKEFIEDKFNKSFQPLVIMTDDSCAERNALKNVFPNSRLLLCIFHVNQALWRYLWQSENNVCKDDRKYIMNLFRSVMFAKTVKEAELCMSNLSQDKRVDENKKLKNHFDKIWRRREEWCLPYRYDVINRGNNTNNYCEASIRIFKDVVLQRCRVFKMFALLLFVTKTFEAYHKKRLLQFAHGRVRRLTIEYEKFCKKSKNIESISPVDETTYFIKTQNNLYVVDSEMATCDCISGQGGRFCKHLCAVEQKYQIMMSNSANLTEFDRKTLACLALGEQFSPDFFEDIVETNQGNRVQMETFDGESIFETINSESEFNQPLSLIDADSPLINISEGHTNYTNTVENLENEFLRITNILKNDSNPSNTGILTKFASELSRLRTPSNIISFMCQKNIRRRGRKIKVQPTSVSRRKQKNLPSSGRIESGRPKKRCHNMSMSIEKNEPAAK